jgi:hypothetical protein
MQNAQKHFEEYCVQWRLKINPKKGKLSIFRANIVSTFSKLETLFSMILFS